MPHRSHAMQVTIPQLVALRSGAATAGQSCHSTPTAAHLQDNKRAPPASARACRGMRAGCRESAPDKAGCQSPRHEGTQWARPAACCARCARSAPCRPAPPRCRWAAAPPGRGKGWQEARALGHLVPLPQPQALPPLLPRQLRWLLPMLPHPSCRWLQQQTRLQNLPSCGAAARCRPLPPLAGPPQQAQQAVQTPAVQAARLAESAGPGNWQPVGRAGSAHVGTAGRARAGAVPPPPPQQKRSPRPDRPKRAQRHGAQRPQRGAAQRRPLRLLCCAAAGRGVRSARAAPAGTAAEERAGTAGHHCAPSLLDRCCC